MIKNFGLNESPSMAKVGIIDDSAGHQKDGADIVVVGNRSQLAIINDNSNPEIVNTETEIINTESLGMLAPGKNNIELQVKDEKFLEVNSPIIKTLFQVDENTEYLQSKGLTTNSNQDINVIKSLRSTIDVLPSPFAKELKSLG